MTMTDRSTVVGVFADRVQAGRAIEALRRAGFNDEQIGFVKRRIDTDTASDEAIANEGASITSGVIGGGALGGILGAVVALLIPGFGPAIAGGILVAALGGAAIGAAAGGIIGALTGMGVPEGEARYYQGEVEAGNTLVIVHAASHQQEAMAILQQYGAYDATSRAGTFNANAAASSYDPSRPTAGTTENYDPTRTTAGTGGNYDPTATEGSYNPNAAPAPDMYDPTAPAGKTANPNATPGTTFDPAAPEGPYDASAAPEPGTYDPTTPTQTTDANATPDAFDVNAPERPVHPSMAPDTYDPTTRSTGNDALVPPEGQERGRS